MLALSPRQKAALRKPVMRVDTFLEMNLTSGVERYWNGSGVLNYDGKDWLGCGAITAIQGLESDTEPTVSEVRLIVSGIDAEAISYLQSDLKGQTATIYDAIMGEDERVIDDLIVADVIDLDTAEAVAAEDGTFTVIVSGQSGFWQLEKASDLTWSPDRQKSLFPGDTGLDLLPSLEDKVVSWTKT